MSLIPTQPLPMVLLHICCAPDSTAVVERLRPNYRVRGFFHDPNVAPQEEYQRRLAEAERVAQELQFELIPSEYAPEAWLEAVRGYEQEPERGRRCAICFQFNLNATAAKAAELGIPNFTTTLSISPHKHWEQILQAGQAAARRWGVTFVEENFKKKDGFKRSLEWSEQLSLYRQDHCGCSFSRKEAHA